MAVRQLKSGKWQGEYNDRHGKVKRPKDSFPTKTEAKQWVQDNLTRIRNKEARDKLPALRLIKDAVESYKISTSFTDTEPSTQTRYSGILDSFLEWCASQKYTYMQSIGEAEADEYGKHLRANRDSTFTVLLEIKIIKIIFRREFKKKNIPSDPFADIKKPKLDDEESGPVRFHTPEELRAIFEHTYEENQRDVFHMLLYSGLATSELMNLPPENVTDDTFSVRRLPYWNPKAKKRVRDVPVVDPIKPIVARYRAASAGKKFFISGDRKYNKSRFYKWYQKVILRVAKFRPDVDISDTDVHTFRKTYGSLLLQQGVPIAHVSKLLGHSSIAITERWYADLLPSNLRDAAAKLNDLTF